MLLYGQSEHVSDLRAEVLAADDPERSPRDRFDDALDRIDEHMAWPRRDFPTGVSMSAVETIEESLGVLADKQSTSRAAFERDSGPRDVIILGRRSVETPVRVLSSSPLIYWVDTQRIW